MQSEQNHTEAMMKYLVDAETVWDATWQVEYPIKKQPIEQGTLLDTWEIERHVNDAFHVTKPEFYDDYDGLDKVDIQRKLTENLTWGNKSQFPIATNLKMRGLMAHLIPPSEEGHNDSNIAEQAYDQIYSLHDPISHMLRTATGSDLVGVGSRISSDPNANILLGNLALDDLAKTSAKTIEFNIELFVHFVADIRNGRLVRADHTNENPVVLAIGHLRAKAFKFLTEADKQIYESHRALMA